MESSPRHADRARRQDPGHQRCALSLVAPPPRLTPLLEYRAETHLGLDQERSSKLATVATAATTVTAVEQVCIIVGKRGEVRSTRHESALTHSLTHSKVIQCMSLNTPPLASVSSRAAFRLVSISLAPHAGVFTVQQPRRGWCGTFWTRGRRGHRRVRGSRGLRSGDERQDGGTRVGAGESGGSGQDAGRRTRAGTAPAGGSGCRGWVPHHR